MQLKFMEGTTSNTKRPGEPVLSSFVFLDTTASSLPLPKGSKSSLENATVSLN